MKSILKVYILCFVTLISLPESQASECLNKILKLIDETGLEISARRLEALNSGFTVQPGGPVKLVDGAIAEGSSQYDGIQPAYLIDFQHPELKETIEKVQALNSSSLQDEDKIVEIRHIIRDQLIDNSEYDNPVYLELLRTSMVNDGFISLGDYLRFNCGVCREHGMLTHIALGIGGFDSHYRYMKIKWPDGRKEDHGFATVTINNIVYIVDSYNEVLTGRKLSDFTTKKGYNGGTGHLEMGFFPPGNGTKLTPLQYPYYYLPSPE